MAGKLNPGNPFPTMTLNASDGSGIELPGGSETPLTIVLFYRGHW